MTPWALGHAVRTWTGLPVVSDNFGYGFEDQARLWLAASDGEALAILARRRARFVLVIPLEPVLAGYARALGVPLPADCFARRLHRGEVSRELFRPVLDSRRGDPDERGKVVARFRLYEVLPVAEQLGAR